MFAHQRGKDYEDAKKRWQEAKQLLEKSKEGTPEYEKRKKEVEETHQAYLKAKEELHDNCCSRSQKEGYGIICKYCGARVD